jgi:uncharacterized protein
VNASAYRRREFIGLGGGGVAAASVGAGVWKGLFEGAAGHAARRTAGYGPLRAPDALGIRLPHGFSARLIAQGEKVVEGTGYKWHIASDGAATFPTDDGGWILVSNSEAPVGGASSVRFDRDGNVTSAYRILGGTTANCSGGGTPWGTWLSCEEVLNGQVWECDPAGRRKAVVRPAMGIFKHEAAAVDEAQRTIYLTEDLPNGCLYRFKPDRFGDLSSGLLEVASVKPGGAVTWTKVPDPAGRRIETRHQVRGATIFKRAEGIRFDSAASTVYIATTLDDKVHAYDTERGRIQVIYDGLALKHTPLVNVDQLAVSKAGELFVCEDTPAKEINLGVITPNRRVSRFLSVTGKQHVDSELTGVAFNPSGDRLYFSSQRARQTGVIYEVRGPFHKPGRARA